MARLFADLTPLKVSVDYRRIWAAHGISNIGQQMTAVAVGIQVYAITQSSFAVGLVGLFQLVPLVGFGLYGGMLSDVHDRRKLGLVAALGLMACSVVLVAQAFAGLGSVALLYVVFLYAGLRIASEAPDTYGRLLSATIALLVAVQAAVIIAGNLRIIPTTGITLPFVSYGGSSLVVNFGLAGLLAGISHASRAGLRAPQA